MGNSLPYRFRLTMSECKKKQYLTKTDAKLAVKKLRGSRSVLNREQYCYKCPDCKYWHLTKQEQDAETKVHSRDRHNEYIEDTGNVSAWKEDSDDEIPDSEQE